MEATISDNNFGYPFFIPPIYHNIERGETLLNVQEEIKEVLKKLSFQYNRNWGKTHKLTTETFHENILIRPELQKTREMIIKHAKAYTLKTMEKIPEYNITSSWFTKNTKDDYVHVHNHIPSNLSGTYYYQTNGEDGDIFFESPMMDLNAASKLCGDAPHLLREIVYYKPQVGKIILFPSFMRHGVRRNTTDSERIGLAFNIDVNDV